MTVTTLHHFACTYCGKNQCDSAENESCQGNTEKQARCAHPECGHLRAEHYEEPNYECGTCDCEGFSYATPAPQSPAEAPLLRCPDCAVRWSCSLEADGPAYEPCSKHRPPTERVAGRCTSSYETGGYSHRCSLEVGHQGAHISPTGGRWETFVIEERVAGAGSASRQCPRCSNPTIEGVHVFAADSKACAPKLSFTRTTEQPDEDCERLGYALYAWFGGKYYTLNHPGCVRNLVAAIQSESQPPAATERVAGAGTAPTFDEQVGVISHDQAEAAALAFVDEHFHNKSERRVQTCIPVQPNDSDVVLLTYIRQQRERAVDSSAGGSAELKFSVRHRAMESLRIFMALCKRLANEGHYPIELMGRGWQPEQELLDELAAALSPAPPAPSAPSLIQLSPDMPLRCLVGEHPNAHPLGICPDCGLSMQANLSQAAPPRAEQPPKHLLDEYERAAEQAQSTGALKQLKNAEAAIGRWHISNAASPEPPDTEPSSKKGD